MKMSMSKGELGRQAIVNTAKWLEQNGICYRYFPPSQLKIGLINYWPSTGTITVDGEPNKRVDQGLDGLESVLREFRGSYPVRQV